MKSSRIKLITIGIVTVLSIGMIIMIPSNTLELIIVPFLLGIIYSLAVGPTPAMFTDKTLYFIALFIPIIMIIIFMTLTSGIAYLVGVSLHKLIFKYID